MKQKLAGLRSDIHTIGFSDNGQLGIGHTIEHTIKIP